MTPTQLMTTTRSRSARARPGSRAAFEGHAAPGARAALGVRRAGAAIALCGALAAGVLLATPVAAQGSGLAQRPPCADALLLGEPTVWDGAELVVADLTLDGAADAAFWRVDGSRVVVLIGSCDGDEVGQRWRFAFDLPADCPPEGARVEAASLLLDEALVERTCAGEQSASECAHLRRENERRRALMDAGGRALRIGGPSCTAARLRWSPDMGGFMRLPG